MAAAAFLGYLLLAGGAPLVIWCSFIANKSFLVLLALASAFYWLISLIAVALLFRAFLPLPEHTAIYGLALLVAVVLQEGARYGAYLLHRIIMRQLNIAARNMSLPKPTITDSRLMALTHGIGHAMAQTIFMYFSWIQMAAGGGTLYLDACPQMSYFLAAGLLSLAFCLLHTFSMVVAFHAYEASNDVLAGSVAGLHLLAALTTLANMHEGACVSVTAIALIEGSVAAAAAAAICWIQPGNEQFSMATMDTHRQPIAAGV